MHMGVLSAVQNGGYVQQWVKRIGLMLWMLGDDAGVGLWKQCGKTVISDAGES